MVRVNKVLLLFSITHAQFSPMTNIGGMDVSETWCLWKREFVYILLALEKYFLFRYLYTLTSYLLWKLCRYLSTGSRCSKARVTLPDEYSNVQTRTVLQLNKWFRERSVTLLNAGEHFIAVHILRKSDIKSFFFSCVFYFFIFISLPLLAPLETRRFCHVDSSDLKAIRRNEIGEYTLMWDIGDRKLIWRMPIHEWCSALICWPCIPL